MNYPTMEEVEAADRTQLARWHRFLPLPITEENFNIEARIEQRFNLMGGMTPGISKTIGWDCPISSRT